MKTSSLKMSRFSALVVFGSYQFHHCVLLKKSTSARPDNCGPPATATPSPTAAMLVDVFLHIVELFFKACLAMRGYV
jgi:hypothetical protein